MLSVKTKFHILFHARNRCARRNAVSPEGGADGMSDMKIVKRKLSELRHPDLNSRKHPEKQIRELKRSIQKNGQTRLLVIDENNVIWIGNGLYQAMTELGMTEAHCLVKEGMSETDKKKMMVSSALSVNI